MPHRPNARVGVDPEKLVTWEEPPAPKSQLPEQQKAHSWSRIYEHLLKHPGKWAKISLPYGGATAASGRVTDFRDRGYEATSRRDENGLIWIYAMWPVYKDGEKVA